MTPIVLVPGILGSGLVRPDGAQVWLNAGNAFGSHDLSLPEVLPLDARRDNLVPRGLLGVDAVLPRLFGFTEYADLVALLERAGLSRNRGGPGTYHVFTYDWRQDLVRSAGELGAALDVLAGTTDLRFNIVAHSMGGLVARYFLRYGGAEPGGPVTWAGARRIARLLLVATPNAGSIPSLDAILNGNRVGFSSTTLAATVIAGMPSIYTLLPPSGVPAVLDSSGKPLAVDLHDPSFWREERLGPFGPQRRTTDDKTPDLDARRCFVEAALRRARAFHLALAQPAPSACPVPVYLIGGDCLPTLGRCVLQRQPATLVRFEPRTQAEADLMFEAGDGRVTRASALAAHLAGADAGETGTALSEISHVFFGHADHHGIYGEPTFQSILLRILLRPARV